MLLQQIVAELDKELERLTSLREIVSGLAGPSVLELQQSTNTVPAEAPALPAPPEAPVKRERARRALKPKLVERTVAVKRPRKEPEHTALTGAIPAAPVVVTAEALAKEGARLAKRSSEKHVEPEPAPGTLGFMIRALRLEAQP